MKRRPFLSLVAGLAGTWLFSFVRVGKGAHGNELENPYAGIDWENCTFLHSMSHQHQGQNDASRDLFFAMGYRHFAFSNYYPSAPTYPLPADYLTDHPGVLGAPNAEQHSFTDAGLHFNSLGSLLATGYGSSLSARQQEATPIVHRFDGLNVFDSSRPWAGVYRLDLRLDLRLEPVGGSPAPGMSASAFLSIEGANECGFRENFSDKGLIQVREFGAGNHTLYFRALAPSRRKWRRSSPTTRQRSRSPSSGSCRGRTVPGATCSGPRSMEKRSRVNRGAG